MKRLRGYLWGTKFRIFSDHKALEGIGKVGDHNAPVQRWLEFLTAFECTLEYRKGSANGNADLLSRLPEPATRHDRTRSSSLIPAEDGGIFLIRACGVRTRSSPTPCVGLSGLMPRPESAALGWPPLTSSDFRMRIDDLSAPSGRFVARVSAAVTAANRRPGRGEFFLTPAPLSLRFLPCLLRVARARQKPPLPRRLSPSMLLPRRALHRESTPPRSLIRLRRLLRLLATR